MSNRTWACISCGKTYRRDQNIDYPVKCGLCGNQCEYVHWKVGVPSPSKRREWQKFWELYKREKELLEQYYNDQSVTSIHLDILNMTINIDK